MHTEAAHGVQQRRFGKQKVSWSSGAPTTCYLIICTLMFGSGVFPFSNSRLVGKTFLCPRYAGEDEPESLADALFAEKVKAGLDRAHPDFPNRKDTI